jgi:hypothetical protein
MVTQGGYHLLLNTFRRHKLRSNRSKRRTYRLSNQSINKGNFQCQSRYRNLLHWFQARITILYSKFCHQNSKVGLILTHVITIGSNTVRPRIYRDNKQYSATTARLEILPIYHLQTALADLAADKKFPQAKITKKELTWMDSSIPISTHKLWNLWKISNNHQGQIPKCKVSESSCTRPIHSWERSSTLTSIPATKWKKKTQ